MIKYGGRLAGLGIGIAVLLACDAAVTDYQTFQLRQTSVMEQAKTNVLLDRARDQFDAILIAENDNRKSQLNSRLDEFAQVAKTVSDSLPPKQSAMVRETARSVAMCMQSKDEKLRGSCLDAEAAQFNTYVSSSHTAQADAESQLQAEVAGFARRLLLLDGIAIPTLLVGLLSSGGLLLGTVLHLRELKSHSRRIREQTEAQKNAHGAARLETIMAHPVEGDGASFNGLAAASARTPQDFSTNLSGNEYPAPAKMQPFNLNGETGQSIESGSPAGGEGGHSHDNLPQKISSTLSTFGRVIDWMHHLGAKVADAHQAAADVASTALESEAALRGKLVEPSETLVAEMNATRERMSEIHHRSSAVIDQMTKVAGITEQTSVLALKIAVYAVKSGSKSFATVANALSQLAQQAADESRCIADTVSDIRTKALHAVEESEESLKRVRAGSVSAAQAARTVQSIGSHVMDLAVTLQHLAEMSDRELHIAEHMHEQGDQIKHHLDHMFTAKH